MVSVKLFLGGGMDINITGICITALLAFLGLSFAIFFGLRGFTDKVGKKVEQARDDVVTELSGINQKIVKIDTNTNNLVQLANAYMTSSRGTIVRRLKNFGDTQITAQPGAKNTTYIIRVEKGILSSANIDRISKKTGLSEKEIEIFGEEVAATSIGTNMRRLEIPSTSPQDCTKYMSIFLGWLDSEYNKGMTDLIAEFESDIEVKSSD